MCFCYSFATTVDDLNTLPCPGSTIKVGHLLLPLVGEEFTKLELPALDVEQSVHTETRLRHKLVARMTSRCCLVHLKKQFHASSQVMSYLCHGLIFFFVFVIAIVSVFCLVR